MNKILCTYFCGDGFFLHDIKYYTFLTLKEWQGSIFNTYIISGKHLNSWLMFNYKKYTQFK